MKNIKYKLTDETKVVDNITLHRIECVTAFNNVEAGEKGGWIESYNNLSQDGDSWVYENARVFDNARVDNNAKVYNNAWVCGNATVSDNATVYDNAMVYGNAKISGYATVCGNAKVSGDADYIVFKNWWSSGRYFTWTRSNNKWKVGCFYGSGEELIAKAYKDSEKSGREYERVVNYVNDILKEEDNNK